jgi:hypothetical protein
VNRRAGRDDDRLDGSPGSESTVRANSAGATEVPTPDSDDPNAASYHAWTLADPSSDYSGEVDTITVDHPSGTSLDRLTDADVTVYMDRDGNGSVDEIRVNSDMYSGSTDSSAWTAATTPPSRARCGSKSTV